MNEKSIEIGEMTCDRLLDRIKRKIIAVPNFQREYVWKKEKIVGFLNSQLKTEPFGTILLWIPKAEMEGLGTRNEFIKFLSEKSKKNSINEYLIDGQQRATSLLVILNSIELQEKFKKTKPSGWNYGKLIKFDYKKNNFFLDDKDSKNENSLVLQDIFGDKINRPEIMNKLKKKNSNVSENEIFIMATKIMEVKKKIMDSKISFIRLFNHNLDEVIEIFSNINTKGCKLTNFDLIHAKWSNLNDTLEDSDSKFNFEKRLNDLLSTFDDGYEDIDKEVFVDSLYLNISEKPIFSADDKINFPINPGNSEHLIKKFTDTSKAFKSAYDFLKGMRMPYKFLPSKIIFKWLSYFYFKTNNKVPGVEVDIIKNYIKLASVNDRYRSSSIEMLTQDIKFIDNVLLNGNIKNNWENWKVESKNKYFEKSKLTENNLENVKYSSNSMISKYIKFLLFSTTKSFFTGEEYSNSTSVDMHHIFPKKCEILKQMNDNYVKNRIDNIVNITLLSSYENNYIGNNNPSKYLKVMEEKATSNFNKILEDHGIKRQYLATDDFVNFFESRTRLIKDKVNDSFNF